jgi:hypothetical protein
MRSPIWAICELVRARQGVSRGLDGAADWTAPRFGWHRGLDGAGRDRPSCGSAAASQAGPVACPVAAGTSTFASTVPHFSHDTGRVSRRARWHRGGARRHNRQARRRHSRDQRHHGGARRHTRRHTVDPARCAGPARDARARLATRGPGSRRAGPARDAAALPQEGARRDRRSRTSRTIQVGFLVVRVGTVAVPGVTTGRHDEDTVVTNGTMAVPGVTRAGITWILRDARARLHRASALVRANGSRQVETVPQSAMCG